MVLLQSVLCDIDFNDSESYRGTSYLPFLGFMVFFAGMMIAFIGIVKISNSRHQWNIFYDQRDRKDLKSPAVNKDRKTGIIMLVAGHTSFAGVCLADPAAWISALIPLIPYYVYKMRKWEKQSKVKMTAN